MNTDKYFFFLFSARLHPRKSVALLSYPLEIVVEHSGMTNQAHLLRQLHGRGSDQGATPRADNVVCRCPGALETTGAWTDSLTQIYLPD